MKENKRLSFKQQWCEIIWNNTALYRKILKCWKVYSFADWIILKGPSTIYEPILFQVD